MNSKNDIIKRYNELYDRHGDSPEALGWTKNKELLRFHILCSSFDLENATIIDFGCGLGYLYGYLKANLSNFHYIGLDINQKLIKAAKEKFPEADFRCEDLNSSEIKTQADYIFSSGVHNIKMEDNRKFNQETFEMFAKVARKGFAINFLSDQVQYKSAESYHNSPSEILNLAFKTSKNIILRNDYMPFEFTIVVSLQDEFNSNTVFKKYESFLIPLEEWLPK